MTEKAEIARVVAEAREGKSEKVEGGCRGQGEERCRGRGEGEGVGLGRAK